mmetsp:Transcript_19430/g.39242  ORF Transcript_19430/g.39242 Transcript_19430/m.39242 type:complete len:186 (+) Transcript_19430:245-802(+)
MVILVITLTKIPGAALPHPGGNRLDHVAYPADVVPVSMAPAHTTRRRANNPEEGGLSYEANPLIPDRRESPPADVMPPKTLENLVPPPKIPEVTPTTTTTTTTPNLLPEETEDTPSPVAPDPNQSEAGETLTPPATVRTERTPNEDTAPRADHEAVPPPIQIWPCRHGCIRIEDRRLQGYRILVG